MQPNTHTQCTISKTQDTIHAMGELTVFSPPYMIKQEEKQEGAYINRIAKTRQTMKYPHERIDRTTKPRNLCMCMVYLTSNTRLNESLNIFNDLLPLVVGAQSGVNPKHNLLGGSLRCSPSLGPNGPRIRVRGRQWRRSAAEAMFPQDDVVGPRRRTDLKIAHERKEETFTLEQ